MPNNPLTNYHFTVQWGGSKIGFEGVQNLSIGYKVIEYRDGASLEYVNKKMPGNQYAENIILKRPVFKGDNEFFEWFNTYKLNTIEKRDLTISVLDEEHNPVVVWKIRDAFPVRLSWSDLNANESKVFIEEIEIAYGWLSVEHL